MLVIIMRFFPVVVPLVAYIAWLLYVQQKGIKITEAQKQNKLFGALFASAAIFILIMIYLALTDNGDGL